MDVKIYNFTDFAKELSPYKGKKVAIVHQGFWNMRGGERMVKSFIKTLPQADVYSLFGLRAVTRGIKQETGMTGKFRFSWLNYLPFIRFYYRMSYPLWFWTFRAFNLRKYDFVLSFSSNFAKAVQVNKWATHWSILFTPTRFLWDLSPNYFKFAPFWWRPFMYLFYPLLRIADVMSAQSPDKLFSVSKFVALGIRKYYGRTVDGIVYPAVEVPAQLEIIPWTKREEYYLAISPYEENKNPELIFESAAKLGFVLKAIGGGSMFSKMHNKYKEFSNIHFLPNVPDDKKWYLLANTKALLMLGCDDYGTIAHEALYAGCPVVSSGIGGINEIVKDGVNGVVLENPTSDGLKQALSRLITYGTKWNNHKAMRATSDCFTVKN